MTSPLRPAWICVFAAAIAASHPEQDSVTLREILIRSDSTDSSLLPDDCLDAKIPSKGAARYFHVPCRLSPSEVETFVISPDGKLKGALFGWELATLPNDLIVYHDSDPSSAATHPLGISVYDPSAGADKKIYPPEPYQAVRQAFVSRVADVYRARGRDWFERHHHSGDPAFFDSELEGSVKFDAANKSIFFMVRYGDPNNADDPLPFTELVNVACSPIDSLQQIRCVETAER